MLRTARCAAVRPGSQWREGVAGYPYFNDGNRTLVDGLVRMAWFATGTAKAMSKPKPGTGSQYTWAFTDANGEWLLGEKNYRFRIPPNPPAKDFWSAVVYDNWTRAILANGQKAASKTPTTNRFRPTVMARSTSTSVPSSPRGRNTTGRTMPGVGWLPSSASTDRSNRGSTGRGRPRTSYRYSGADLVRRVVSDHALRLYAPKKEVADGTGAPPPVKRAS